MKKIITTLALVATSLLVTNVAIANSNKKVTKPIVKSIADTALAVSVLTYDAPLMYITIELPNNVPFDAKVSIGDANGYELTNFFMDEKTSKRILKINTDELESFTIEVNMNGTSIKKVYRLKYLLTADLTEQKVK
jgi:hypothetical protein